MKRLFQDNLIYENILLAYYSENDSFCGLLNEKLSFAVMRFLDIFESEDKQKGTNHTELIKTVYTNPQFEDMDDYLKYLNISGSTLRRYRERYCSTLKLIVENIMTNGDNTSK